MRVDANECERNPCKSCPHPPRHVELTVLHLASGFRGLEGGGFHNPVLCQFPDSLSNIPGEMVG